MAEFHDVTVTFTSKELTAISDILRRLDLSKSWIATGDFLTAFTKLEIAKSESYDWTVTEDERREQYEHCKELVFGDGDGLEQWQKFEDQKEKLVKDWAANTDLKRK
jgi:hypothetical protein